jgi:hypothetical protein
VEEVLGSTLVADEPETLVDEETCDRPCVHGGNPSDTNPRVLPGMRGAARTTLQWSDAAVGASAPGGHAARRGANPRAMMSNGGPARGRTTLDTAAVGGRQPLAARWPTRSNDRPALTYRASV